METKETDIKKLSDADLDSLIEYGIQQQENVPRHSDEYQHYLNVVANAKQEKSRRDNETTTNSTNAEIAEDIPNDKVEESSLSTQSHENMKLTPKPTIKQQKQANVKKNPKPTVQDGTQIPADKINQGLPGVTTDAAKDTPENRGQ